MSRSGMPATISVLVARPEAPDTPAIIGTDGIVYIDGRWSRDTAIEHAYAHVSGYLANGYRVLGYQPLGVGDYSGRVYRF